MTDILKDFPRVSLCHQPTPIEEMRQLAAHMGGPNLWVKRDDCTGLATGGNKTRKLEFLMAQAVEMKADCVVTQGAVQSNHVRQTAAAACRLGMKPYALLERRVTGKPKEYDETGNVFFDHLFGTEIEFRDGGLDMNAEAMALTDRLRTEGKNPYFIPGGGSNEIGALRLCCLRTGNFGANKGTKYSASGNCSCNRQYRDPSWAGSRFACAG